MLKRWDTMNDLPLKDTKQLWKAFVERGELPGSNLSPIVKASWQRCYAAGVDPYDGCSHTMLGTAELERLCREHAELIKIALPIMKELNRYVAGSGFLVMLSSECGYIMEVMGNPETLAQARQINFIKGAAWTEQEVGTNAIGTVLQEKIPLQISSDEHYCQLHHVWTCSAAPIFNDQKQIIGVLNMSGPSPEAHQHTLGMVVSAATAIMFEMRLHAQNQEIIRMSEQMRNVFMSISDGVMIIDQAGRIVQLNPVAENLLGRSSREMENQFCTTVFPELKKMEEFLNSGSEINELETYLQGFSGTISCILSGQPFRDEEGSVNGGVLIFNPLKKLRSLVNRISGAHASFTFQDIIGQNPKLLEAVQTARLAADKRSNILLQGESGTGKELFAQAIHNASSRRHGPFVALNCGAIPRELLGSELFGYVDGAFTGARKGGRTGKFELASGGTLFLDEIGEMPLGKQVSLLRAVQEKEITRIGDDKVVPVDVRIICATNKDLRVEVEKGNFRQDLYYRLNVIRIKLPSLRERPEDIPLQFHYFLEQTSMKMEMSMPQVEPAVLDCLCRYDWPGNVRELQNVVERMINISNGREITIKHLPQEIMQDQGRLPEKMAQTVLTGESAGKYRQQQKLLQNQQERQELEQLLEIYGGNISRIAQVKGVSRNTIYRRMRRLGMEL
ncbi:MAG TPA: sigma-54-dependent Fis family transcriptional regulator [Syntrophomonas sp.]|nr:sigma-54-dependent Fis family transcriptional regulator [Syntrophomonas sp.]HRW11827.1 sigma-54-dependent Fis family transcriptional regulator [Syntrophomonas sp.]